MTIIQANGVDLSVETFGDPAHPAVLLVAGTACSMDWWEPGFCERLASESLFVIRYDHRDTGQSVNYEPGAPPYTLADLTTDAAALIEALGLERAHIVGKSMGGWIGQLLALDHADRVAALTLISSRPTGHGAADPDLPEISDELAAMFSEETAVEPDWADRDAVIDYLVAGEQPFAGSRPVDEAALRDIAGHVFDRTANLASTMTNHFVMAGGERWRERLGEVKAPTLVLHGTDDPMFPYGNAEALAREIPGARLVPIDGHGHENLPRERWDFLVEAIARPI